MLETELNFDSAQRQSYSLGLSVGLHLAILFLMLFNFSWSTDDFDKNPPVVLMVDLSKVELSNKTNLPPEVKVKKEEPPKPQAQPKKEAPKVEAPKPVTKTPAVRQEAPTPKPAPVKPKEAPTPKNAVKVQETPKPTPKKPVKKEPAKTAPKKPTVQPKSPAKTPAKTPAAKQTASSGLQSLLASVEKVKKPANPMAARDEANTPITGQEINNGIKGGTGGSRMEALTISEKDLIASKIRNCWNVNAGVEGADSMTIEIKAFINKDGRVKDVRVLNMKGDPVFRSMADSAVRAIWVCDSQQDESPFKILSVKHPENYSSWKEIYLRMNPIEGVF